jgi:hypothetical protein
VITVSAAEGYQVTTTVPVASVGQVSVGERASMVPDGSTETLAGTVVAIGTNPTSSGYPVTLGLPAPASGLRQGGAVSVALTTGTVQNAVVVPTSAVRSFGTRHVVEVLSAGAVQPTVVTVGVMDPEYTQILTGLTTGEQVVLADLSSTVTSDSTTTGTGGGLGGRALGGGGFGGGGGRTARVGG